ncbi:MAG: lipid-A-disaccharide synthase [Gammaproteobacteria bacterium]|nr:MAG: lipid-A-disaccharide synthase [Gammaproteobacteria bacterium]
MKDKTRTIMIVAGETSGDLLAASVVDAINKNNPHYSVCGLGGSALAATGAKMLGDITDLAVMGIWEVLVKYRKIRRVLSHLESELAARKPDLLILVDYVEFNLKLAKTAKRLGIKVLFFVSPQVWAWRHGRVKKIGSRIDMMAVLFPFEVKFYRQHNVPVSYVGHPMIERIKPKYHYEDGLKKFNVKPDHPVIGLFPGSRKSEIKYNLPVMIETAEGLKKQHPSAQFLLPVASNLSEDYIRAHMGNTRLDVKLITGYPYDVIQLCDVILTASGTANLEIALLGKPMVVLHRIAAFSYFILIRLVTIKLYSLVNIFSDKEVVKELVQKNATPERAMVEINRILDDNTYRQTMIDALADVKIQMGTGGAAENVARLVEQLLNDT